MSANSSSRRKAVLQRPPSLDELDEKDWVENEEEEEEEVSEDLPSFKSVIYRASNSNNNSSIREARSQKQTGDLFFDSQKCKWVKVDNFAFSESENHFEKSDESSLALLDSKILDEAADSNTEENTNQILDDFFESVRRTNVQEDHVAPQDLNNKSATTYSTNSSSQPNSLDVSFDDNHQKPKIHSQSPREVTPPRKTSLRKLSSKEEVLPSRTPRGDFVPSSSTSSSLVSSKIPKFVQKRKDSTHSNSPVQKRVMGQIDRSAKKLGQNRSHSATNLNKLSVKDYHGSFQLRRRST